MQLVGRWQMESKLNIDSMTPKQLRHLRDKIDETIFEKQAEAKKLLRERFEAMAAEVALDVSDIIGKGRGGGPKPYAAASRKYRDPKTGVTWAGRGRMPKGFDRKRAIEL